MRLTTHARQLANLRQDLADVHSPGRLVTIAQEYLHRLDDAPPLAVTLSHMLTWHLDGTDRERVRQLLEMARRLDDSGSGELASR